MSRYKLVGVAGVLLGLVVSLAVVSPASALDDNVAGATPTRSAHGSGAAMGGQEATRSYQGGVLTITTEDFGEQFTWNVVRVNCSNNFDGDPTNNTFPGPNTGPWSPSNQRLVDGYLYLLFGPGQPVRQQILVPDWAVCIVQQTSGSSAIQPIEYRATADDPDTVVAVVQPSERRLGSVQVTWPTRATDPAGGTAQVTITNRGAPCYGGQTICYNFEPIPTNTIRIKARVRGDAPDPPSFTIRLRCSGAGVMEEHLFTFSDQNALEVPAIRNRCVIKETDTGGADRVEYFATSRTGADTSVDANSARVDFADSTGISGGGHARLQVTNSYAGS